MIGDGAGDAGRRFRRESFRRERRRRRLVPAEVQSRPAQFGGKRKNSAMAETSVEQTAKRDVLRFPDPPVDVTRIALEKHPLFPRLLRSAVTLRYVT